MSKEHIPYPPALTGANLGCTWGWFKVKDIFHVATGRKIPKRDHEPGTTRHITASKFNNGCSTYLGNTDRIHDTPGITVSSSGSVGHAFYQPAPFYPSGGVLIMTPKEPITPEVGLFLTPLFELISEKYSYVYQPNITTMGDNEIPLPITETGDPDWGFMHGYMSAVLHAAANTEETEQAR